jgi:hypothetical protein
VIRKRASEEAEDNDSQGKRERGRGNCRKAERERERKREKAEEKKKAPKTPKTHGEEVGHVVAERAVVGVLLDRHDLDRVVPGLFLF